MKKFLPLTLSLIVLFSFQNVAQNGSVGIGTSSPDPSSALHVHSVNKGLLAPRLSSSDRDNIDAPANGLLVYDTDNNRFVYYNGDQWGPLGSTVSADTTITGIGTASQPLSLAQQGATAGQVLKWGENGWAPSNDSTIPNLWNETTDGICYQDNVGIGTCQPQQRLHINSDSSDVGFRLSSSSHRYIAILDETEGTLSFSPDSLDGTKVLSLGEQGNIGIGTTNPQRQLHINRDTGNLYSRFSTASQEYIAILDETEGTLSFSADSLNGNTPLSLTASGNVGIGTTKPQNKIHMNSDTGNLYSRYSTSNHNYIAILDETEGTFSFGQDTSASVNSTQLKKYLTMDSNGRVGIGRTDTSAKLNVEGTVKANELTIENGQGDEYSLSADSNGSPMWHESIISLHDTSSITVQTVYSDFNWDVQRYPAGKIYNYNNGNAIVEINKNGYYRVSYNISINNPSGISGESFSRLMLHKGSGFSEVPSSHAYASHFSSSNPKINSLNGNMILKCSAGDRFKLQLKASISGMETLPKGCRINIKKIAY